jgi:hypothetical protein
VAQNESRAESILVTLLVEKAIQGEGIVMMPYDSEYCGESFAL